MGNASSAKYEMTVQKKSRHFEAVQSRLVGFSSNLDDQRVRHQLADALLKLQREIEEIFVISNQIPKVDRDGLEKTASHAGAIGSMLKKQAWQPQQDTEWRAQLSAVCQQLAREFHTFLLRYYDSMEGDWGLIDSGFRKLDGALNA